MGFSPGGKSLVIAIGVGLMATTVAIIGTQFFEWEWGDSQFMSTIASAIVATATVVFLTSRID